ncbi:tumor necrosis factor ligand superfamily member 14 isoform X1 [Hemicordylus capensis]|uniref:tumor necrosis factor ligand superfamily member 14 isoform X1 n=1 Tax=Hemicordylus capensis TaxID=884348 RepID=UPI002302E1CF|nr:tumor necrosis factor ligand superfamily member 14 isoform X1 [Hemicordylus capensis]
MEAGARYPSVFVVDGPQRDVPFVPPVRRHQKTWPCCQLILGVLMLLILAGLGIQGYFLICFRKELDRATAEENAEATHEKFVQDHKPAPEKPAAHLTGASFTASGNSTLQWEHTLGLAFLQDMGYKGGSLICNKPGHYYIYSKLYLGNSGCPHNEQKNMWVVHSIYKRTPRYPEDRPLLINNILYCNSKDSTFWWHNSFLAGVVQLEENEEIYIKVSERQLVRIKDEFKSYFGAFMI